MLNYKNKSMEWRVPEERPLVGQIEDVDIGGRLLAAADNRGLPRATCKKQKVKYLVPYRTVPYRTVLFSGTTSYCTVPYRTRIDAIIIQH